MLESRKVLLNRLTELGGLETKGASPAGVNHTAIQSDQVKTRGLGSVGAAHAVIHLVYIGANAVLQSGLALRCDRPPFRQGLRIFYIRQSLGAKQAQDEARKAAAKPPSIAWVGFSNIDDEELNFVMIALEEIPEAHGPRYEGRSGDASEDQGHGLLALEVGKPHRDLALDIQEIEVWGGLALLGRKCVPLSLPRPL